VIKYIGLLVFTRWLTWYHTNVRVHPKYSACSNFVLLYKLTDDRIKHGAKVKSAALRPRGA
jgi:hypothetical protein